jgi:hypothetical protein
VGSPGLDTLRCDSGSGLEAGGGGVDGVEEEDLRGDGVGRGMDWRRVGRAMVTAAGAVLTFA